MAVSFEAYGDKIQCLAVQGLKAVMQNLANSQEQADNLA
jgi:hypothetical protein